MSDASNTRRQRRLIAVALAVLGIYAIVSVRSASSAGQHLELAQQDLNEIKQKLAEIDKLKQAPRIAALDTESEDALGQRVEQAFDSAGLPGSTLDDFAPSKPETTQNKDFKRQNTRIELVPTLLPKIVGFCDALCDESSGSIVSELTLEKPLNSGGSGRQENWAADLTLTRIIFSPTSR